tara:strand:- start:7207 stop:8346 length:1140 start_codon:yes stop_codon:yes gene_type:complete
MIKEICDVIKNNFEKLNSNFGDDLFNNVKHITENFTKNLTFFDLKDKIEDIYLDYMVLQYCISNKNTFVITVWPVTYEAEDIFLNTYNKYGSIIYKKEIRLKENGFKNILHFISDKKKHPLGMKLWFAEPHRHINPLTIYIFESKEVETISVNEKINYLTRIFNNNRNHILQIQKKGGLNNLFVTTRAKRECRNEIKIKNKIAPISFAPDRQYSHHVNDEHHETIELCRIFLNDNSIFALNKCNLDYKCLSFDNKYKNYVNFINDNKWGKLDDFCLNNSSVLSQFGIRQSRDIDYLHNHTFNISKQIPEEEISSHNYVVKEFNLNIDEIIYNPTKHFWFKNIKFITLDELLLFKKKQMIITPNNLKAKNDFKLITSFLQ